MSYVEKLNNLYDLQKINQLLECGCGGHYVKPETLGFDSDGSVLVCDNPFDSMTGQPCTEYVLVSDIQNKAQKIKQEGVERLARVKAQSHCVDNIKEAKE